MFIVFFIVYLFLVEVCVSGEVECVELGKGQTNNDNITTQKKEEEE